MNAQIKMRLITSKYRRYKFIHTASCTAHTDRSPTYYFSGTACGRQQSFVRTSREIPLRVDSGHRGAWKTNFCYRGKSLDRQPRLAQSFDTALEYFGSPVGQYSPPPFQRKVRRDSNYLRPGLAALFDFSEMSVTRGQ